MISVHPIPAFNDNYIWALIDQEQGCCIVIDPGDATPVKSFLKEHKLHLLAVFVTHHHQDHTGGIAPLIAEHPCPVYAGEKSKYNGLINRLKEGDRLLLMGQEFLVLEVPGHTLDHIAYVCENLNDTGAVFCGDTLFVGGCGRIFEGDAAMMLQSLKKLSALPETTKVFCTHEYTLSNLRFARTIEPDNQELIKFNEECERKRKNNLPTVPSTISIEKKINPFLRTSEQPVKLKAQSLSGRSIDSETEIFAIIRKSKDQF